LLALVNTGPDNLEELKILEMSLNKEGILSKFLVSELWSSWLEIKRYGDALRDLRLLDLV
jgi:hypothetical protein